MLNNDEIAAAMIILFILFILGSAMVTWANWIL